MSNNLPFIGGVLGKVPDFVPKSASAKENFALNDAPPVRTAEATRPLGPLVDIGAESPKASLRERFEETDTSRYAAEYNALIS